MTLQEKQKTKFALVTGASSGIGRATALELAKRGFKVFACARRVDKMADLKEHGIEPLALDVTDLTSVLHVKEIVSAKTGGNLHILFNNAGQICMMPALDVTDEIALQCFDVNVFGAIRMTREFSPLLINAKGCVAFTGSVGALFPFPFGSVYSATKAAIHLYLTTLHMELKPFGVKVLNFITGSVDTGIPDRGELPKTSLYYNDVTLKVLKERKIPPGTSPELFAIKVVNDLLSTGDPLNLYRGKHAKEAVLLSWLPVNILETVLLRMFNFSSVFAYVKLQNAKDHRH